MLFEFYLLLTSIPFSRLVGLAKSDCQHGDQFFDAHRAGDVSVLKVEAAGLAGGEQGLDLPAFTIVGRRCFGVGIGSQNEQLSLFQPFACKMDARAV